MKIRSFLLLSIPILLFSCQQNKETAQSNEPVVAAAADSAAIDIESFKETYKEFFYSIIDGKPEKFNNFIHPELGLFVIDSRGAIPTVVNVKEISGFLRADGKSFFDFDRTKVGYELIQEELPKVDCDHGPDFYSKQGAFTEPVNPLKSEMPWKETQLAAGEKEKITSASETVMVTVINTSNYRYYFSQMGGKWYVTFIDLRRPCNA